MCLVHVSLKYLLTLYSFRQWLQDSSNQINTILLEFRTSLESELVRKADSMQELNVA